MTNSEKRRFTKLYKWRTDEEKYRGLFEEYAPATKLDMALYNTQDVWLTRAELVTMVRYHKDNLDMIWDRGSKL